MKFYFLPIFLICNIAIADTISEKTDLWTVFQHAKINDPVFAGQREDYLAAQESLPQAIANSLPDVKATADLNFSHQFNKKVTNIIAQNSPSGRGYIYSLSITQPVLNFARWKQISRANADVKQAEALFNAAYQQLIIRVSQAYFTILQVQNTLAFTKAEKRANKKQLEQATQRFDVGLDAITSVHDAQASYDEVLAREITAKNNVENQTEVLRAITGYWYSNIKTLKKSIVLVKPNPNNVEQWDEIANKQNYTLLASKYASQSARHAVGIERAGHFPSIAAIGQFDERESNTNSSGRSKSRSVKASFQLTVPIFQSGLVLSRTRQAAHKYSSAISNYDSTRRLTTAQTRQTYNSVIAGISKIKASKQAVKSAKSLVNSTEASLEVGTRTIVDLLKAQKDMYAAQRGLSADYYIFLIDTLKLKQVAGTLSDNDLKKINSLLK